MWAFHDGNRKVSVTGKCTQALQLPRRNLRVVRRGDSEDLSREQLESIIESNLSRHWPERSAAIVIDPELEAWVWSESPTLVRALGSQGDFSTLRDWLKQAGFGFNGPVKPARPKEALEKILRQNRKRRSSDLYGKLSSIVTLAACTDPAFEKLRRTLQSWFPALCTNTNE